MEHNIHKNIIIEIFSTVIVQFVSVGVGANASGTVSSILAIL